MGMPETSLTVPAVPSSDTRFIRRFPHRLLQWIAGRRPSPSLLSRLLALALFVTLMAGYHLTSMPVTLVINGQPWHLRTHQTTVEGLLREADIRLHPKDLITPPPDTALTPGSVVQLHLARPVTIEADGRSRTLRTQHRRVADILAEAGVWVKARDEVLVDGQVWDLEADLPQPAAGATGHRGPGLASAPDLPAPMRIVVRRAVPVLLSDDGVPVTFYTTQATVGQALLAQGILLYLGDRVTPSLGSRILPGMRIYIERSTPVVIQADGHTIRTRTQGNTVGEVLTQEGIALMGLDYSLPSPDTPIAEDMTIRVVRVSETLEIEQQPIPFETRWVPDPDMPLDTQQLVQPGESGVTKRRYRVRHEDGQEVARVLEDEWIDHPPQEKIIAYGTKIIVQTLETPDGTFEYWRHFRALATSYSAATSGKPKDHPRYGVTRTGLKAGYGIIAVDPRVIPLWTEVYIPGYGKALAGDTGGAVLGRHVDLGFDEDEPPLWYRWVDVYILTPVPPADQIRYVLPNWPQER